MAAIDEWTGRIHQGHAGEVLADMPESSVHCVITSPPYYLLRDYGEGAVRTWDADPDCDHVWTDRERYEDSPMREEGGAGTRGETTTDPDERVIQDSVCTECGAWRGQLGLEPTVHDFMDHLMDIFAEVRRVLRPDGVLWVNIDDKYATADRGNPDDHSSSGLHGGDITEEYAETLSNSVGTARGGAGQSVRRKSMFAVPERFVLGMIDAGWVYRSRGVWRKLNHMPGPWQDRFTHQWEPFYMFTPEPKYWFDVDAVREPHADSSLRRSGRHDHADRGNIGNKQTLDPDQFCHPKGKNPGDVFEVTNPGFPEAHYAVFPDKLVVKPVKASCPPSACAECGTPYECDCGAGEKPGVVLDPFAGRGTVGKVAAKHGRRHVLIDLDPESVDLATDYVPKQRNGILSAYADGGLVEDAEPGGVRE